MVAAIEGVHEEIVFLDAAVALAEHSVHLDAQFVDLSILEHFCCFLQVGCELFQSTVQEFFLLVQPPHQLPMDLNGERKRQTLTGMSPSVGIIHRSQSG